MLCQRYIVLDENAPSLPFLKYLFLKRHSVQFQTTKWECVTNKSCPKTEKSSDVIISDNIYTFYSFVVGSKGKIAITKLIIH